MNGWGFKRITEGPDLNAYYHESFLRGLPELVSEMRRPQKGELPVKKPRGYPENPDFYKISSIAPLPSPSTLDKESPVTSQTPSMSSPLSSSAEELAVISERSGRSKREMEDAAKKQQRLNEETDAAAALFFGEVASVGSWVDGADDWHQRSLSPTPEQNRSFMGPASSIPRELKIPQNRYGGPVGDRLQRPPEEEVLSKADLAYLAQQNRLLLRQARMIGGVKQQA